MNFCHINTWFVQTQVLGGIETYKVELVEEIQFELNSMVPKAAKPAVKILGAIIFMHRTRVVW